MYKFRRLVNNRGRRLRMEIKKSNRVKEFFKRFGVYVAAGVLVLGIAMTFTITALVNHNGEEGVDVGGKNIAFVLPMSNPTILKDYSSTELQENTTLNQWEAHLAIDFTSEDKLVYAVYDGTVADVSYDYLTGNTVTIKHKDGFVSYYSSLGKDVLVKKGDTVKTGQKIGSADETASGETDLGAHLHFMMTQNDSKVDPNNYLDLANK